MQHQAGSATHGDEPEIHLPPPSFSPFVLSLGVMLFSFGILYGLPLIVVGGVFFLIGIATWLIDDAREFVKMGDHGHGGH